MSEGSINTEDVIHKQYVRKDGSAVDTLEFYSESSESNGFKKGVVSRDGGKWEVDWSDGGKVVAEEVEQRLYTAIATGRGAQRRGRRG